MPSVEVTTTLAAAGQIVTSIGPYLLFGVGFLAAGWLLRKGWGLLAKGVRR
jgi:hypothetical protein